jgi:hypothetical protein
MYTILIAVVFGFAVGGGFGFSHTAGPGWSVLWGVLAALAFQAAAGFWLKRKVEAGMNAVQNILLAGQKRLQAKVSQWQLRPPGSPKQAQIELEREQRKSVDLALEASKGLERWSRWSPLLGKQITTLRMQLYYQIQEFKKVDELMPRCLFIEPMTAAMKLARMYQLKDPGLAAFFEKQVKRSLRFGRGADAAILYAAYSWMLVQRGEADQAHKILIRGCEKAENETLKRNRDLLANNKINHFNNAGLGDLWYALCLEEPKVKTQRQRPNGSRPF